MGISVLAHKIQILTPDHPSAWDACTARIKAMGMDDLYFYLPYINLYCHQGQPEAFVYEEGEDVLYLPYVKHSLSIGSGRWSDFESPYGYSGPLASSNDQAFLKRAWDCFFAYCREAGIITGFIRFHPILENHRLVQEVVPGVVRFSNQVVTLGLGQSVESVLNGYSKNTRNKVSKAKRSGVRVRMSQRIEDLKMFQKLYYKTMDHVKAGKNYYFGDAYFDAMARDLSDCFCVYIAEWHGIPIGGVLLFLSDRYVYFHLSANLVEYRENEPASLLRHEVILSQLPTGRKQILFGGGKTSDAQDSLFRFKKGFSNEAMDFYAGMMIFDPQAYASVCRQWETENPEKAETAKNYFQKYKL